MPLEETRLALVNVPEKQVGSNMHQLLAAQIIFRYRLLDIFADTLDVPCHPSLTQALRLPLPPISTTRLDSVCSLSMISLQTLSLSALGTYTPKRLDTSYPKVSTACQ